MKYQNLKRTIPLISCWSELSSNKIQAPFDKDPSGFSLSQYKSKLNKKTEERSPKRYEKSPKQNKRLRYSFRGNACVNKLQSHTKRRSKAYEVLAKVS